MTTTIHGPGAHPWLTDCGQDRANVRHWTKEPTNVTCRACLAAALTPNPVSARAERMRP